MPPQSDSCSLSQSHCSGCSEENKSITHSLVRGKQGQDVAASSSSMDYLHVSFKIDMTSLYIQMLRLKRAHVTHVRLQSVETQSGPFRPIPTIQFSPRSTVPPVSLWDLGASVARPSPPRASEPAGSSCIICIINNQKGR